MQLKKRYSELYGLLLPLEQVWQREVLQSAEFSDKECSFPQAYQVNWLESMEALSEDELYELEGLNNFQVLKEGSLPELLREFSRLCEVPKLPYTPHTFPPYALSGVTAKKSHEISTLASYFSSQKERERPPHVVDIGTGLGHLSHLLARCVGIPCTLVEADLSLHQKSRANYQKKKSYFQKTCDHLHQKVGSEHQWREHIKENSTLIGLHSCGNLSVDVMNAFIDSPAQSLLNLGCCYYKVKERGYHPLSLLSKKQPIPWTKEALSLATRPPGHMKRRKFDLSLRVKNYRYTFALFLREEFGITKHITLGPTKARDYRSWSFATYVREQLKRLSLETALSDSSLTDFSLKWEQVTHKLISANFLRNQLGRPLELLILLDRALYLEENTGEAHLLQAFDPTLSPRNLAVVSSKHS